jgi:hypothetical protein
MEEERDCERFWGERASMDFRYGYRLFPVSARPTLRSVVQVAFLNWCGYLNYRFGWALNDLETTSLFTYVWTNFVPVDNWLHLVFLFSLGAKKVPDFAPSRIKTNSSLQRQLVSALEHGRVSVYRILRCILFWNWSYLRAEQVSSAALDRAVLHCLARDWSWMEEKRPFLYAAEGARAPRTSTPICSSRANAAADVLHTLNEFLLFSLTCDLSPRRRGGKIGSPFFPGAWLPAPPTAPLAERILQLVTRENGRTKSRQKRRVPLTFF